MKYSDIAITWAGDITSISSYAQYARLLLEPLIKGGAVVRLEPGQISRPPADLSPWWHDTIRKCIQINPLYVRINHCEPHQASGNLLGGPNILFTHWPTNQFPVTWRQFMANNNFHMLLTTHPQALNDPFLTSLSIEKDYVMVPIEADPHKDLASIVDIKPNTFVFGSVGIWNQKSNFSDLIIAYTCEFSSLDNIALVIKTMTKAPGNPNEAQKLLQLVKGQKDMINKPDKPPIIILQDLFHENAMDNIVRRFNCYVSTKRGTSVDYFASKALGMGKPLILPNVGISRMYLNEFRNIPKAVRMIPISQEPVTAHDGGAAQDMWGRNDVAMLMKHMKDLYIDTVTCDKELSSQLVKMKAKAVDLYSPENQVDRLANIIRQMQPKPLLTFS